MMIVWWPPRSTEDRTKRRFPQHVVIRPLIPSSNEGKNRSLTLRMEWAPCVEPKEEEYQLTFEFEWQNTHCRHIVASENERFWGPARGVWIVRSSIHTWVGCRRLGVALASVCIGCRRTKVPLQLHCGQRVLLWLVDSQNRNYPQPEEFHAGNKFAVWTSKPNKRNMPIVKEELGSQIKMFPMTQKTWWSKPTKRSSQSSEGSSVSVLYEYLKPFSLQVAVNQRWEVLRSGMRLVPPGRLGVKLGFLLFSAEGRNRAHRLETSLK